MDLFSKNQTVTQGKNNVSISIEFQVKLNLKMFIL